VTVLRRCIVTQRRRNFKSTSHFIRATHSRYIETARVATVCPQATTRNVVYFADNFQHALRRFCRTSLCTVYQWINQSVSLDFWITNWSHIATVLVLVGATLFKKALSSVVSNRIGMKFCGNVLHVNSHWLTKSDFWHDVILSRWRPWRHYTYSSLSTVSHADWVLLSCETMLCALTNVKQKLKLTCVFTSQMRLVFIA